MVVRMEKIGRRVSQFANGSVADKPNNQLTISRDNYEGTWVNMGPLIPDIPDSAFDPSARAFSMADVCTRGCVKERRACEVSRGTP